MDAGAGAILGGLNPEQRRAAEAVRGPVCILAGAGSGKTTTITRRIAWQVASGAVRSQEILAVTFTDKAATEMRGRLERLGVEGVEARTFHSAALAQLRRARGEGPGRILSTKALLLRQVGNTLPRPYRFRPAGDLATEVEWAKNRRLTPETYRRGLGGHEPPIPADLMERVFREYERRKAAAGLIDFEDLLELAVRMYEEDEWALAALRERYLAFTVDEYQDVNLLQQSLLELWLGGSEEICAVGDDYQSIYGFTGASPEWLLGLERRFPNAHGREARVQLPLVAGGPRAREPPRAAARRRREDAAADAALGGRAGRPRIRLARGRGRVRARAGPGSRRRGRSVRGDGRADAPERALCRLRGALRRREDPVPGLGAPLARRCEAAPESAPRQLSL